MKNLDKPDAQVLHYSIDLGSIKKEDRSPQVHFTNYITLQLKELTTMSNVNIMTKMELLYIILLNEILRLYLRLLCKIRSL